MLDQGLGFTEFSLETPIEHFEAVLVIPTEAGDCDGVAGPDISETAPMHSKEYFNDYASCGLFFPF